MNIPDECHIKHVLLVGEPGTAKTTIIHHIVRYCIQKDLNVLFAYATEYQARETQFLFCNDNVKCDTIHSLFKIPVDGSGSIMNWALMQFDVIIIDKVGMVTFKLDTKSTDYSCIFTTMVFVCEQSHKYNCNPILTFDQPIYWKANEIQMHEKKLYYQGSIIDTWKFSYFDEFSWGNRSSNVRLRFTICFGASIC